MKRIVLQEHGQPSFTAVAETAKHARRFLQSEYLRQRLHQLRSLMKEVAPHYFSAIDIAGLQVAGQRIPPPGEVISKSEHMFLSILFFLHCPSLPFPSITHSPYSFSIIHCSIQIFSSTLWKIEPILLNQG